MTVEGGVMVDVHPPLTARRNEHKGETTTV